MLYSVPRDKDVTDAFGERTPAAIHVDLLDRIARGDKRAFAELYDLLGASRLRTGHVASCSITRSPRR